MIKLPVIAGALVLCAVRKQAGNRDVELLEFSLTLSHSAEDS